MSERPSEALPLNEDFLDLLEAFLAHEVEFLVIGAHALAVHGLVRATADLDVLVRPTAENAERVIAALREFGAPLQAHGAGARDFAALGTVYQIGQPPRRIDVLTAISGVTFEDAHASRKMVAVRGRPVPFLGRDALLANKRASGRLKDLADAEALERLRRC